MINKIDLADADTRRACLRQFPDAVPISAAAGMNMDALKNRMYSELRFIRIYMKPQGAPPDKENPLVMRASSTVADVCSTIHRDFVAKFRYARIWGQSVKYGGQRVGLSHVLADGDMVSVVVRK